MQLADNLHAWPFLDPGKATELRTLGPCDQVEFSSFDLQLRRCLMYSNQHSVERVHQGFTSLVDKKRKFGLCGHGCR